MVNKEGFQIPQEVLSSLEDCHTADKHDSNHAEAFHVRRVVAGNPNTPQSVLARLAEDHMPSVRARVAENPRTPEEVLIALAKDTNCDVRLAVAENPNTPEEILRVLAGDEDVDVRYGVAENPHIPGSLLEKLSGDENPYISWRAYRTMKMLDITSGLEETA